MSNAASLEINATLLPAEIRKVLDTISVSYTPADSTEGWYYMLTDIQTSSRDLIKAKSYLQKGSNSTEGGTSVLATPSTVNVSSDKVKFLFIKHTGYQGDGTSNTADSIYLCLDAGVAAYTSGDCIEIGPNECWFGKLDTAIGSIHCISDQINRGSGTPQGDIQAQVFAIIDDI